MLTKQERQELLELVALNRATAVNARMDFADIDLVHEARKADERAIRDLHVWILDHTVDLHSAPPASARLGEDA